MTDTGLNMDEGYRLNMDDMYTVQAQIRMPDIGPNMDDRYRYMPEYG